MITSIRQTLRQIIPPEMRAGIRFFRRPRSFALLERPQYDDDGLATRHVPIFLKDERFNRSYRHGKETGALEGLNFDIEWRAHVACWCAAQALKLNGDFVECGVGRGLLSKTIVAYVAFERQLDKRFFLVDTFEGLAEEHMSESEKTRKIVDCMASIYRNNFERVASAFEAYPNVTLINGTVPEVLNKVESERVAYLSIDMNNAKPEIEAARYFWPKLEKGGLILLDDFVYGVEFHEQTQAFLAFAKEVGHEILVLPTGQGLLIKQ